MNKTKCSRKLIQKTTGYFLRWWTPSFPGLHFLRWQLSQISHPRDVQDVKFPTHERFTKSNSRGFPATPPPYRARAKSEVLVIIPIVYSKKNKRQQRKRLTKSMGLISKKTTLRVQHTFLYISLPLFCTATTWNLLLYTRFIEEMSYAFPYAFFHCRWFSPWRPLAFVISSAPLKTLHVFLPTKFVSFVFLSLALALSLLTMSV